MSKKVDQVKEPSKATIAAEEKQVKRDKLGTALEGTEAGTVWNEIKDMAIEMFALPGQVVAMHCTPVPADPTKLFLLTQSTAVLPSLEVAINKNAKGLYEHRFDCQQVERFVVVTRVQPPLEDILKKYGLK